MEKKTLGYLSFAYISLIWGTTYLVTHIGVLHFPAILFTGIRNGTAGLILMAVLLLMKVKYEWTWKNIYPQLLSGVLIIALGNGMVSWALHIIPTGLSALLCTFVPINMILLNILAEKTQRMNWLIVLGLAFGLAGMGFVFRDNLADIARPEYLLGVVLTFVATVSWSAGSLYARKKSTAGNPFYKAALQLISGGLTLVIASLFAEDWSHLPVPDTATISALLYLIVFGSTLAFAAYQYALSVLPAGVVSVYAYINPLVALILGYQILNERVTWYTFAAFVLTITGIYFINKGYQKPVSSTPEQ